MVNVTIAGGTSPTLGKAIIDAIATTGDKHKVIILSRASETQPASSPIGQKYGVPVVAVDYTSVDTLTKTLANHATHTLISVLKSNDAHASVAAHANLLEAAKAAKVSRFIMSDWSVGSDAARTVDLLGHKGDLHELGQQHMQLAKQRGEHTVECSTIQTGMFMEYFVQGCPGHDSHRSDLLCGLQDDLLVDYIDIANRRLVVPCKSLGPGKHEPAQVAMTSIRDIGRDVAAALELGPGELVGHVGLVGQTCTFEDVADMLARLDPPLVLAVVHVTREDLDVIAKEQEDKFRKTRQETGEVDVKALKNDMVAQIFRAVCDGDISGDVLKPRLNELCPGIVPTKLNTLLAKAWGR